jgi:hypothetical protein
MRQTNLVETIIKQVAILWRVFCGCVCVCLCALTGHLYDCVCVRMEQRSVSQSFFPHPFQNKDFNLMPLFVFVSLLQRDMFRTLYVQACKEAGLQADTADIVMSANASNISLLVSNGKQRKQTAPRTHMHAHTHMHTRTCTHACTQRQANRQRHIER